MGGRQCDLRCSKLHLTCHSFVINGPLLDDDGSKMQKRPLVREEFIEEVMLELNLKGGDILDGS